MTTLDEIIAKLLANVEFSKDEAKSRIIAWALEIVGEDEKINEIDTGILFRNEFRRALRKKLDDMSSNIKKG